MATRFYLPSIGLHQRGASSSPAPSFDAGWTQTTNAIRRRLVLSKEGSAYTTYAISKNVATNPTNAAICQFVSPPLQAQTISSAGFLKGIIQCFSSSNPLTDAQLIAKVMSADGTTSRGTLIAMQSAVESNDWNTTQRNIKFPLNYTGSGGALTQVVAQDSDTIVIEIGGRMFTASTGVGITASIRLGDVGSGDLTEDETSTANGDSWFEFSQTLLFWDTDSAIIRSPILHSVNPSFGEDLGGGNIFKVSSGLQQGQGLATSSVTYFMAAFDSLGARYYWNNSDASFTNAPVPVGSYVVSTLVIEGRIISR